MIYQIDYMHQCFFIRIIRWGWCTISRGMWSGLTLYTIPMQCNIIRLCTTTRKDNIRHRYTHGQCKLASYLLHGHSSFTSTCVETVWVGLCGGKHCLSYLHRHLSSCRSIKVNGCMLLLYLLLLWLILQLLALNIMNVLFVFCCFILLFITIC